MGRSLRHSLYLLAVAAGLTFAAGAVFAQAAPSVVPVNISPVGPAPGGLQTMATYSATGAGAANGYYSRPVLVSNNTLGALGRGLLRRAAPVAAMMGLIEAAGWVIDELTGQVLSGPPVPTTVPPGGQYWKNTFNNNTYPSAYAAAAAYSPNGVSIHSCGTENASGVQSCQATVDHPTWGKPYTVTFGVNGIRNLGTEPFPLSHPGAQPAPVPDADIGQAVANNPALAAQALRNPDGSVNRNPDVMAEAQALAQELAAANPLPDPTAEWDTGYQGGEPQPSAANSDLPAFCSWAAKVCELADWLMDDGDEEPAPVDLPVIEPDTAVTWNSGLGGGSCPADISVGNVMGAELVFPLSGFCLAADMIRPLVLAAAALLALLIVGGFRHAS